MKYFVAYLDSEGVIVRQFPNREEMIMFCQHLGKNNIELLCVWAES